MFIIFSFEELKVIFISSLKFRCLNKKTVVTQFSQRIIFLLKYFKHGLSHILHIF